MKKLISSQISTEIINGKLAHVELPYKRYLSVDEIGEYMKTVIDGYIESLKKQINDHQVSHAFIVFPLIHVPFDDLNKNNEDYQRIIQGEQN